MKYFFAALFSFFILNSQAQTDPTAPYLKNNAIPVFTIQSINGKEITNLNIPKYRFTCIIIFSPDCPHCEEKAEEINKNAAKFKEVLFIWASFREMEAIKKFGEKHHLKNKANVMVARDPNFMLPSFYHPRMTPFMAIYDKNKLLKVYEKGAEINELISIVGTK